MIERTVFFLTTSGKEPVCVLGEHVEVVISSQGLCLRTEGKE